MADAVNQGVKTKREIALDRLRNRHPDGKFEDDEEIFDRINGDYDEYDKTLSERDKELEEMRGREKGFSDLFATDPRSVSFFMDWKNGGDPMLALIRRYGPDIEDIIHDPEKQEAIAEANKEYADRVLKEKDYEEEYSKNIAKSIENMDALVKGGKTDEEVSEAFSYLLDIVQDGLKGNFKPESFAMAFKAINHDRDVTEAALDGEVLGRNAKIDEKLRKGRKGDGTAPLGGNGGGWGESPKGPDLGALGRFGGESIYDRGGETRKKHY